MTEFIFLIGKIYLVINGHPLEYFIYLIAAQNCIYAIAILGVYFKKYTTFPKLKYSKRKLISITKQSIPMVMATFMIGFYMYIDQIMLNQISGNEALGYFAPSSMILIAIFSLRSIFSNPFQVQFAKLDKNTHTYNNFLQNYFSTITQISIVISICVFLAAPIIVTLLFGEEYQPTIGILMVQVWACVFAFQGAAKEREIINSHKTSYNLISVTLGAISNVIGNLFLIPLWDGIGAAMSTNISLFIAYYLTSWLIPELRYLAKIQSKAFLLVK